MTTHFKRDFFHYRQWYLHGTKICYASYRSTAFKYCLSLSLFLSLYSPSNSPYTSSIASLKLKIVVFGLKHVVYRLQSDNLSLASASRTFLLFSPFLESLPLSLSTSSASHSWRSLSVLSTPLASTFSTVSLGSVPLCRIWAEKWYL